MDLTINNLCRVCLKNSNFYSNIYKDRSMEEIPVYELVNDLCALDISVDDGFPEFLCCECFIKVQEFKTFKTNAHKVFSVLLLLKDKFQNPVVKQEELDIPGDEYEESFVGTNIEQGFGPIILKQEMLTVYQNNLQQEELIDSEEFENVGVIGLSAMSVEDTPQQEEMDIDSNYGDGPEEPFEDTNTEDDLIQSEAILSVDAVELPDTSKEDTTQQPDHYSSHSEFCEEDSIRGASSDDEMEPLMLESEEETLDSVKVEMTLEGTVTHPKHLHCLENKRPYCTSSGDVGAVSCSNADSIFVISSNISWSENIEASSSGTMERLDGQKILPREGRYMAPFHQQDLSIRKEVDKERRRVGEEIGGDREALRITGPEKGVRERRKGLECFHCGIVLMSKLDLVRHMKVHGFVNSYECAKCDKVFRFHCQLKTHVLTHTGSKPYKCAVCCKSFSDSSNLKTHLRIHTGSKPYKCAECSKSFSHSSTLKAHVRIHTGSKPYKCAECSKSFHQSAHLKSHIRIHTGSKPYKCAECSKGFSHSSTLKAHVRIHTGSKPYKCAECSKCFNQSSSLIKHMRTHTGSKPYKCAVCSKSFSQSSSLIKHMRTHTGSKPYKCAECSKSFAMNSNLTTHLRTHTGLKQYKCAECNKSFSRNYTLKKHMRSHISL